MSTPEEPTTADRRARRARSFGSTALAYAEHRPDYPADAVRWALAAVTGSVRRVLDLGAGTGALTGVIRQVLGPAGSVVAVERDRQMLAELQRRQPDVEALAGPAEAIPLPDASVDAVLVGQAFHWFDPQLAPAEMARVLRPGGGVGLLWNIDDLSVEWVAGLRAVARADAPGPAADDDEIPVLAGFDPLQRATFRHHQRRTAESLTATIGTHSHTLVLPPDERAALLGRVRSYLDGRAETGTGEFELPMITEVLRGRVAADGPDGSRTAS